MTRSHPAQDRPRHLTVADVCHELGVARSTFYDWRAKGAAPRCLKLPNGELRIRRVDFDAWLSSLDRRCRMNETTYDVRVWAIRRTRANGVRYKVRWKVGRHVHYKTCATRKLADSFRSALIAAATPGRRSTPTPACRAMVRRQRPGRSWFDHAQAFTGHEVARRPPHGTGKAQPKGSTTITLALVSTTRPLAPEPALLRRRCGSGPSTPARRAGGRHPPRSSPNRWRGSARTPARWRDLDDLSVAASRPEPRSRPTSTAHRRPRRRPTASGQRCPARCPTRSSWVTCAANPLTSPEG